MRSTEKLLTHFADEETDDRKHSYLTQDLLCSNVAKSKLEPDFVYCLMVKEICIHLRRLETYGKV